MGVAYAIVGFAVGGQGGGCVWGREESPFDVPSAIRATLPGLCD